MKDNKIGVPFSVWGEVTEEKVQKAILDKADAEITKNKVLEMVSKEDEENKKDTLLRARVSADYYKQLKKAAKERGINMSSLVRNAIEQYIPATLTDEEKERAVKENKKHSVVGMIWALVNSTNRIRENYNYEPAWTIPEEETLLKMYKDNTFKEMKIQTLNSIIAEICLTDNLDKDIEESIKALIKAYMIR